MKKDIFLVFLSSLPLILSFPPFNIWIFAWFGLIPLFFAIKDKGVLQSFLFSYLTGLLFFLAILYWLVHVSILGLILLVLYLALYFGIFGGLISFYRLFSYQNNRAGSPALLQPRTLEYLPLILIPCLWVGLEFIRSHLFTGFGWAVLGYSQYLNIPIIQCVDITGSYGVTFLIVMVNVAIFRSIENLTPRSLVKLPGIIQLVICIFVISAVLSYGHLRLQESLDGKKLRLSVIQGNIPQEVKWEESFAPFILEEYINLTYSASKENPDLIIWPETSVPASLKVGIKETKTQGLKGIYKLVRDIKIPLLTGIVSLEDNKYYNSALLLPYNRGKEQRYDKLHLVPFGEYIPLRRIFFFLEEVISIGDFSEGRDYTVFELSEDSQVPLAREGSFVQAKRDKRADKFSVLICFEDIFPNLARSFIKKGAKFLVNITNDAWFKKTSSPYQHLQASVFRAIENRVFLVRAANTGISGFISPQGEIISTVKDKGNREIFIAGYKTEDIFIGRGKGHTFYTLFGDVFALCCLGISTLFLILRLTKHEQKVVR